MIHFHDTDSVVVMATRAVEAAIGIAEVVTGVAEAVVEVDTPSTPSPST